MSTEKRQYRKRQRAEDEERTRRRITEATVALHETVGPLHTTVKAVAARAGVQRATVYRHFPDEGALFAACSAHWLEGHRPPDPTPWTAIADPEERLRTALSAMYRFYRDGESMVANVLRDEPYVETLAPLLHPMHELMTAIAGVLLKGRPQRGRRRMHVAAAVAHALAFDAWRSLARGGLDDEEIVELMVALVRAAGAPRGKLP
ncbi:MAG TPA: TetR/AcrR family transcriptional regulator [Myxococcota bacterium]|nr:TetR/AcrR family transcriptional regulator [Myxococcota bacterium]